MRRVVNRFIALLCALTLLLAYIPAQAFAEGHWADEQMQKWQGYGILSGYENGELLADNYVSRAEAAKIISDLIIRDNQSPVKSFNDVSPSDWYYSYVHNVVALSYMVGVSDAAFGAADTLTREQAGTIVYRVFKDIMASSTRSDFGDFGQVSSWAAEAIAVLAGNGVINGYADGNFYSAGQITRAEFITMLDKIVPNVIITKDDVKNSYLGNVLVLGANIDLSGASISGIVVTAKDALENPPVLSASFTGRVVNLENTSSAGQTPVSSEDPAEPAETEAEEAVVSTPAKSSGGGGGGGGGSRPAASSKVNYLASHTVGGVNYVVAELNNEVEISGLTYAVDSTPATASKIDSAGTLIKIAIPAGIKEGTLTVKNSGGTETYLTRAVSYSAAGSAAPETLYGTVPMKFSEFFYDITGTAVPEGPAATTLDTGGTVAAPALFITQGTRTGSPTYAQGDSLAKVDVISSATYGDTVHFVPEGNLTLDGSDRYAKTDPNAAITGIKQVEVGVNFDLYANALLREAAGKKTAQSTNIAEKMANFTLINKVFADGAKTDAAGQTVINLSVYKVKYLLQDGNWGQRSETALNAGAVKDLPGHDLETEEVAYGGNWGDKVTGVTFGALEADYAGANYWDNFAEYLYGGYIEDANGHREPLVFLQNIFSHRMHEDFDIAISPSRFARLNNLAPYGEYNVVVYAYGFADIVTTVELLDYKNGAAQISGDTSFKRAESTGEPVNFTITRVDAYDGTASIKKGAETVDSSNYTLVYNSTDKTLAVTLKTGLFIGAFQGSYTVEPFAATSELVSKSLSFTLIKDIERSKLKIESNEYPATEAQPLSAARSAGRVDFVNEEFAKSVVIPAGRTAGSTVTLKGSTAAIAGAVVKTSADEPAYVDLTVLEAGREYVLTAVATGFDTQTYYLRPSAETVTDTDTVQDFGLHSVGGVNYVVARVAGGTRFGDLVYKIDAGEDIKDNVSAIGAGGGTFIKIAIPAGVKAGILTVKNEEGNATYLTRGIAYSAAGSAEPETLYGTVPMKFSEFFYDITGTDVPEEPAATTLDDGGIVVTPDLFITQGTRTGNPTYAEGDQMPKVDVISSATYGDSVHFVPEGNLTLDGSDRYAKTDPNAAITGIKKVEVGVSFDLYANALLREAANRRTAQSTNIAEKMANFTLINKVFENGDKTDAAGEAVDELSVYNKVKYLLQDGNWGQRSETALNADAVENLPGAGNGGTVEAVAYGGNWGDKVTGFSFGDAAALGPDYAGASYWDNFAEYIYGGYIKDSSNNIQPLVFLQNLFSHRMHEDFDVAISPSRFARLGEPGLDASGTYNVVVYAYGFEDIEFEITLKDYKNGDAQIFGPTSFKRAEGGETVTFTITGVEDYNSGSIKKGQETVDSEKYTLSYNDGDKTLTVTLKQALFSGAFQGSYTVEPFQETSELISKSVSFTLIKDIGRSQLKVGQVNYDATESAPLSAARSAGKIYFAKEEFANSVILPSGRAAGSTVTLKGSQTAIADALVKPQGQAAYVDLNVLQTGREYVLTAVATGFETQTYYLTIENGALWLDAYQNPFLGQWRLDNIYEEAVITFNFKSDGTVDYVVDGVPADQGGTGTTGYTVFGNMMIFNSEDPEGFTFVVRDNNTIDVTELEVNGNGQLVPGNTLPFTRVPESAVSADAAFALSGPYLGTWKFDGTEDGAHYLLYYDIKADGTFSVDMTVDQVPYGVAYTGYYFVYGNRIVMYMNGEEVFEGALINYVDDNTISVQEEGGPPTILTRVVAQPQAVPFMAPMTLEIPAEPAADDEQEENAAENEAAQPPADNDDQESADTDTDAALPDEPEEGADTNIDAALPDEPEEGADENNAPDDADDQEGADTTAAPPDDQNDVEEA